MGSHNQEFARVWWGVMGRFVKTDWRMYGDALGGGEMRSWKGLGFLLIRYLCVRTGNSVFGRAAGI